VAAARSLDGRRRFQSVLGAAVAAVATRAVAAGAGFAAATATTAAAGLYSTGTDRG